MRRFLIIIFFGSTIIFGCGKGGDKISDKNSGIKQKDNLNTESVSGETVEIKLPTIQCGTCKKNITKALEKINGINQIDLSVDDKLVKVNFDGS